MKDFTTKNENNENTARTSSNGIWSAAIPALATVLVALVTSLGTIWLKTSELEAARQNAIGAGASARMAETSVTRIAEEARGATGRVDQALSALESGLAKSPVPVGTIVASILTPPEYAQTSGDPQVFDPTRSRWASADGSQVVGSLYHTITNGKAVPDLRGVFLRGVNLARVDGNQDPDGSRLAGQLQRWSTGFPRDGLTLTPAGNHTHGGPDGIVAGHVGGGRGAHASGDHVGPAYGSEPMKVSGEHVHEVSGGDPETRPTNVAVYYYIRING
jgi:hypothetical protein